MRRKMSYNADLEYNFNNCIYKEEGPHEVKSGCCNGKKTEIKDTIFCNKRRIAELKPCVCAACRHFVDKNSDLETLRVEK